ncbi:hypothetical protein [Halostella salina]|uniref:hypothetical protein n=1 Tax=Halostella salina TaxID=1547897 RepID=UPI000EF761E2|nr:hypothetical protein [Halostella salina]
MAMDREGFLSMRSLSYVNELLAGERELDQNSVSYTQLSRDTNAAFADFARLAMVKDLHLLHLWAASLNTDTQSIPAEDMNSNQFRDWLATLGLGRTLRMYDDALHTEFEDQLDDRLQKLMEVANEEFNKEEISE